MDHCQFAENYSRIGRLNSILLRFLRPPLHKNHPFSRWKERALQFRSLRTDNILFAGNLDEQRLLETFCLLDPIALACMWGFLNVVVERLQASMETHGKLLASFEVLGTEHLVNLKFGMEHKSCLHFASEQGHRDIVLLLLRNGANVNAHTIIQKNENTDNREHARHRMFRIYGAMSALHYAAREGHEPVALALLENGAEIEMQDIKGETALMFATASSSQAMVQLLLDSGANPNNMGMAGTSPLKIAAQNGNVTITQLLTAKGADVDMRLQGTDTALHDAIRNGCVALTRLLLGCKADVTVPSAKGQLTKGMLPLHTAAYFGSTAIVKLLIDHGAYIDARSKVKWGYDWTALHVAVFTGDLKVAQLLLLNNADVKARCGVQKSNMTPLQMAISRGHKRLIDLLTAKEAEIDEKQARHPTSTRVNSTKEAKPAPVPSKQVNHRGVSS